MEYLERLGEVSSYTEGSVNFGTGSEEGGCALALELGSSCRGEGTATRRGRTVVMCLHFVHLVFLFCFFLFIRGIFRLFLFFLNIFRKLRLVLGFWNDLKRPRLDWPRQANGLVGRVKPNQQAPRIRSACYALGHVKRRPIHPIPLPIARIHLSLSRTPPPPRWASSTRSTAW